MTFFNPLLGSLVPPTPARQAAEKGRQIARSQALQKNAAAEGDRVDVEHQVESTDELHAAGDQSGGGGGARQSPQRGKQPPSRDDVPPHIDVKA